MMGNRFNEIMQKLRAQRVRARRYTAMLLALAMLTSLSVSWRLHQVGTALTTDSEYYCGMEEHVHTDECYTEELVCGYEEGEPEEPDSAFSVDPEPTIEEPEPEDPEPEEPEPEVHHHTADCYETVLVEHEVLTCGQEEHAHDDDCTIGDDGEFLCGHEEHTHTDDCFTTETETEEKLVCGYEEGQVLSDGAAADDGIAALEDTNTATSVAEDDSSSEAVSEPVLHHHTEACYEKVLTCTIPEHTHTLECLADYSADVETADDWEKYSAGLSDKWNEALLAVAREQLGYKESEKNFQTDEALGDIIGVHHYTRYGDFYGNPYADWDVAFIAFCQHYAGIPKTAIPQRLGLDALRADMEAMGFAYLTEGEDAAYEAIPGDVVTYNKNGNADDETIGIVETVGDGSLTVISGAVEGAVAEVTVPFADVTSTILVDQAYDDYVGEADDRDADYDDEIAVQPAEEKDAAAVYSGETQYPINLDNEEVAKKLGANFELQKKDSDGLYQPVTNGTTVNEGDDLQVVVDIKAPADTFSKTKENGNKLTYTLPFKLKEPLENKEIYDKDHPTEVIGYLNADKDGNVTVKFLTDNTTGFDCEGEVQAEFKVWGNAVAKGTGENQTITFPGDNGSFTLIKKSDISVKKEVASDIIEEDGKTYFKYTITVNSNNGTAGETVDIRDQITSIYKLTGQFDEKSFVLKKNDEDVSNLKSYLNITTATDGKAGFTMSALPPLEAGESYTLTYRYEITNANTLTANDYGEVVNKAYAKYGNHDEKGTIEIKKGLYGDGLIIKKTGGYSGSGATDLAHGRIKWQVDIQNPSGKDLKGYVVTDKISSETDAVIREQNGVEVYVSQDGSKYSKYIVNNREQKGAVTEGKKGFTYEFPEGSTGKYYQFIYYTTNPTPQAGKTTTVENEITAKRGDKEEYTGKGTATVQAREGLLIKAPRDKTLDVVDSTKLKKDWSIAVRTAAETDAGKTFTIKDTFQPPKVNESESATLKHYAIKSVLDGQLKAKMNLYWVRGDQSNQESLSTVLGKFPGVKVTFEYYKEDGTEALNEDDHVTSFKITVDWKNADPKLIITQLNADNYTSYIEDISSLNAGDTVKATNTIECAESKKKPTEATNSYTKPKPEEPKKPDLTKLVATDNIAGPYNFGKNTATIQTGTPNGTVIWFKLLIKHPNADTVTITDTLPKGLKYVDATTKNETLNWLDSYYVGTTKNDSDGQSKFVEQWACTSVPNTGVFQLTTSKNETGQQVLTFTLSGLKGRDLTNDDASIIYGVIVEDDYWKDISNDPSKKYPNEARWGDLEKSATATVTRTNFETQKDVKYDKNTQTATYTVTINAQSKQLLPYPDGYLKLEDKLSVPTGLSATLDQNSIVVKDENGNIVVDALGKCNIYPDTHTMEIEIKDGKKYELSYTYKFVPHEGLPANQTLTVTNEVEMFGHIASNKDMEFHNGGGSGTASNGVTDILTLVKSEKGKNNNTLGGVTFELSEYGGSGWTSKGNQTTATKGDAKGTITFRYNANGVSETGTVAVKADTLYKLVETKTANDYILDDTPRYFVMLSKDANADDVYRTFTGSDVPLQSNIKFVSAGQMTDVLKVENEARKIKVEKVWKDANDNEMTAPQDSITVTLQRKVGDDVDSGFSERLTLTKDNGWKVTYPETGSLPGKDGSGNTYYYFVTEDDVPSGYSVTYSYVDENSATQSEHGVTAGGTATITNQKKTDWLNVTKVWQYDAGADTSAQPPEITVNLYKIVNGEGVATGLSLKLNAGNSWSGTFTGLNPDTKYYVVEDTVDGYTVSYTSDAAAPAVPGATITVTNTKNSPGYELPATGSTGTAPYTTAGAVLMAAALVGGCRRKRRQERRGE